MLLSESLHIPGEHALLTDGRAGQVELILTVPKQRNTHHIALLGHPHSLEGGTMNNKVVTTLVRIFQELHIPSIRFNFRGVGLSEGVYNSGHGESADMLDLAKQWWHEVGKARFIFAGFSFGSYVAYRAAAQFPHELLITIAPPVHHYDFCEFVPSPQPWIIVQGDEDEIVPLQQVLDFSKKYTPESPVLRFAETGHFFHSKLIVLKARLIEAICQATNLCP
jgi:alpha/beta superfamily hydrolase